MSGFATILSSPYLEQFASGLVLTLLMTVAFVLIGGLWGIVLTMLRAVPGLDPVIAFYISCHRNVPLLVQAGLGSSLWVATWLIVGWSATSGKSLASTGGRITAGLGST